MIGNGHFFIFKCSTFDCSLIFISLDARLCLRLECLKVRLFGCSNVRLLAEVPMFRCSMFNFAWFFSQMFECSPNINEHRTLKKLQLSDAPSSDYLESLDYPWATRKKFILRKPYLDYNLERVSLKPNISCCWLVLTLSFIMTQNFEFLKNLNFDLWSVQNE